MNDDVTMMRADEITEGMHLDLEGDTFATFFNGGARANAGHSDEDRKRDYEDHQSTISMFEFEFAEVETTEHETEDCTVIHTSLTSFGCPHNHMLKVVNNNKEE